MSEITPSVSSASPTPTDGGSSSPGSPLMQRGASYFFGFLITFVVLLLIFMCCGVGSRRRYLARRALMSRNEWEAETPPAKPALWEAQLEKGGLDWGGIAPLTASLIRKPNPPPPPPGLSLMSPVEFIRPFFHYSQNMEVAQPPPNQPSPEALQVAVIIAMPCSDCPRANQNDPSSSSSSSSSSQFEIGVSRVRWETEVES